MLISFIVSYLGFALLSLSKERHFQQVWPGRKLTPILIRELKVCGWLLLGTSLSHLIQAPKISIGITHLFGIWTFAALLIVMQLTYGASSIVGVRIFSRVFLNRHN
ncbi:MAG TPA: DUF3325 domain-containing protein [Cellvibrionaceae bacterium]